MAAGRADRRRRRRPRCSSIVAVVAMAIWRSAWPATGPSASAVRWLGSACSGRRVALTFVSPSLAVGRAAGCPTTTTTPSPTRWCSCWWGSARPRCGAGGARAARSERGDRNRAGDVAAVAAAGRAGAARAGRCASVARLRSRRGAGALAAWAATHGPPPASDGGFPAAAAAAERIEAALPARARSSSRSLPDFKSVEAYAYPLVRDGRRLGWARTSVRRPRDAGIGAAATAGAAGRDLRLARSSRSSAPRAAGPAEAAVVAGGAAASRSTGSMRRPGQAISIYRARATLRERPHPQRPGRRTLRLPAENANAGAPNAGVRSSPRPGPGGRTRVAM